MSSRPEPTPAERREALLRRSAQLRERLAQRARVFRPALRVADKIGGGAQWMRSNPTWALMGAAALAGVVAVRPGAAVRLAVRAWSGWQLLRRARPIIGKLRQFF